MENKLELKHLAPYLPYGVQIIYSSDNSQREMLLLDTSYDSYSHIFKPLLIPLSELTDEQWIEVFKVGFDNTEFDHSSQFSDFIKSPTKVWINYRGMTLDFNTSELTFRSDSIRFNQLAAFNKLFELHADVYGLLEAGLALNKLEHGKYRDKIKSLGCRE